MDALLLSSRTGEVLWKGNYGLNAKLTPFGGRKFDDDMLKAFFEKVYADLREQDLMVDKTNVASDAR